MKKLIRRYRINRSWGDGVAEALWWSFRGKSFPYTVDWHEMLNEYEQEINNNKGDK